MEEIVEKKKREYEECEEEEEVEDEGKKIEESLCKINFIGIVTGREFTIYLYFVPVTDYNCMLKNTQIENGKEKKFNR